MGLWPRSSCVCQPIVQIVGILLFVVRLCVCVYRTVEVGVIAECVVEEEQKYNYLCVKLRREKSKEERK